MWLVVQVSLSNFSVGQFRLRLLGTNTSSEFLRSSFIIHLEYIFFLFSRTACLFLISADDYSGAGDRLSPKMDVANFIHPLPPILLLVLLQILCNHLLSLS